MDRRHCLAATAAFIFHCLAATAAFVFRVVFRKNCPWMLDAVQPRFRVSICAVAVRTFDAALRQKKRTASALWLGRGYPSNDWTSVDSEKTMSEDRIQVELQTKLIRIYVSGNA